ncbi:MAG: CpsB/CapC family capsule biosynthesis tyrosine phosphatase [Clostridia bacterium]|jgi:protein-tyrosine phosphatase
MFVDIHSHILPKLDDGAANMETSLSMLEIASLSNIQNIIATPHFIVDSLETSIETIDRKCSELNENAKLNGINIKTLPGCEVFISPEIVKLIENGTIATLNNSKYVLIEFPLISIPPYSGELLYSLQIKGFKPIIAHPERNKEIIKNPGILYEFVQRGIYAQMNANSLTGVFGNEIAKISLKLLEHKLIHFISSDAHTLKTRSPNLTDAANIVRKKFGNNMVDLLFSINGMNVINDMPIDMDVPKQF